MPFFWLVIWTVRTARPLLAVKRNYPTYLMASNLLLVELNFDFVTLLQLFQLLDLDVPEVLTLKSGLTLTKRSTGFANGTWSVTASTSKFKCGHSNWRKRIAAGYNISWNLSSMNIFVSLSKMHPVHGLELESLLSKNKHSFTLSY